MSWSWPTGLLYVVAQDVGAPTAQALLRLVDAMLNKEGLPTDRRPALAVVAVDALPKGSTVELQLYAEENVEESAYVENSGEETSAGSMEKGDSLAWGMFGAIGQQFSRVMQERAETLTMGSLVLQVAGRVGRNCVVHAALHTASALTPLDPTASRDAVRSTLLRMFAAALEAVRCSGLSAQSCVCVRLLRHVDWAPTADELTEAVAGASGALPAAVVEVGTLYRGEPMALHVVAAAPTK